MNAERLQEIISEHDPRQQQQHQQVRTTTFQKYYCSHETLTQSLQKEEIVEYTSHERESEPFLLDQGCILCLHSDVPLTPRTEQQATVELQTCFLTPRWEHQRSRGRAGPRRRCLPPPPLPRPPRPCRRNPCLQACRPFLPCRPSSC